MNAKQLKLILFPLLLIWCAGFSVGPILGNTAGGDILYPIFKKIYSQACHQISYKSFSIFGYKLLVCARCTGIYLGALGASITSLFIRKRIRLNINLLIASLIPLAADVFMSTAKIYNYSKATACVTGIIFGSVVFLFILEALENSILQKDIVINES
jgi:uncharacterized membrane protein